MEEIITNNDEQEETQEIIKIKTNLVNILVYAMKKAFFFTTDDISLKIGDKVIVETSRGLELGEVISSCEEKEILSTDEFPKYVKMATDQDLFAYDVLRKKGEEAIKQTQEEARKLNLDMTIISADYTIDATKIIICYLSDARVDFRELLKNLASIFHSRIELRQIGTRDKAKMIGGIGICGLKLCCSTFLNEFDGISITMAKNQMLALNIPKLSGHCGKLICCLKFENDAYLDAQKDLPRVGLRVKYNDEVYKITSMNVITRMIRLETKENVVTVPYEEIKDKILPKDYAANQQALAQKKKKEQLQEENNNNNNKVEEPTKEETSTPTIENKNQNPNNRRNNFKRKNNNSQGKKQNEKN
ncbi:MAG: stage 0 sporulation family protein [Bacilli bacterium]